jgi:UDP-GlcNAc:undecaprenyl-phosphate/decaprenyl-phosphate GlcNAc-1-phosphate transferase
VLLAAAAITGWRRPALFILAAAALVGTVGLLDDAFGFGPLPKLSIEIPAAVLVVSQGVGLGLFDGPMDPVLTVVWLVILTNSFNLLDNMDGALASVGLPISALLILGGWATGQTLPLIGGAILCGAFLGFLLHNWHPARIFMGDAGALFVGFLLSALVLELHFPSRPQRVIALLAAIFDTSLVVISRVRARRPIYVGSTDHTAHRLLKMGLGIRQVAAVLLVATALSGMLGLAAGLGVAPALLVVAVLAVLGVALLAGFLMMLAND